MAPSASLSIPRSVPRTEFVGQETLHLAKRHTSLKVGLPLKSNLKNPRLSEMCGQGLEPVRNGKAGVPNAVGESMNDVTIDTRSVQWIDKHGKELIEVREFVPSDSDGSDNGNEGEPLHACTCVVQ
eukprot:c18558_g2_i1 orf=738-1115(-)